MTYTPHPLRVRLSRQAGYKKPAGAVVVSRPSKWGNPFRLANRTREATVALFRFWLLNDPRAARLRDQLPELRGKQLACWCPLDGPCHADVLAELANA